MSLFRSFLERHSITTPSSLRMLKFHPPTDLLSQSLSLSRSSESSSTVSPSVESVSESSDEETDVIYPRRISAYRPEFDSDDDADSEGAESDATLDSAEIPPGFGYPLERIPRQGSRGGIFTPDSDGELGHGIIYHPGKPCSSSCTSFSSDSQSLTSVTSSLTDCRAIVEELLGSSDDPFKELDPQNFITFDPTPSTSLPSHYEPPLMIKRSVRDSTEISLLLELNSTDLRKDPWNPCPHIFQVVDHDPKSEYLYLCIERLTEYNAPPMTTVVQYIDFFRQILEGLSFLHEHGLVGFSCSDPSSYMVDLSSGMQSRNGSATSLPPTTDPVQGTSLPLKTQPEPEHPHHHHHHHHHHHRHPLQGGNVHLFDRSTYPVRYYFVNFTHARRIEDELAQDQTPAPSTSYPPSKYPPLPKRVCPFKQDVKELGFMFDRMLSDVPSIVSGKFRALVKAMMTGGFGAEDARKLFEALSRSLEAGVFDMPVRSGIGVRSQSYGIPGSSDMSSGVSSSSSRKLTGDFGLEPGMVTLSS